MKKLLYCFALFAVTSVVCLIVAYGITRYSVRQEQAVPNTVIETETVNDVDDRAAMNQEQVKPILESVSPDSAIIRHRARAVIFVERFLITISSFLIQAFAALIFNLLLQIYLMTILVSRASLAPSPRKLMQSTVISRARPGGNQSHGLWESTLMDWAS